MGTKKGLQGLRPDQGLPDPGKKQDRTGFSKDGFECLRGALGEEPQEVWVDSPHVTLHHCQGDFAVGCGWAGTRGVETSDHSGSSGPRHEEVARHQGEEPALQVCDISGFHPVNVGLEERGSPHRAATWFLTEGRPPVWKDLCILSLKSILGLN